MTRTNLSLVALFALCSAGAAVAADGTAQTALCLSCHGQAGLPTDETIPIVQGQEASYIEKQLRDYKDGTRDSQIMNSIAGSIRDDELALVARSFTEQPWPKAASAGHEVGPAPEAATSLQCAQCHGTTYQGGRSGDILGPRLAGQNAAYLAATMDAFASGERANNEIMANLMKATEPEQREALAKFLAGL